MMVTLSNSHVAGQTAEGGTRSTNRRLNENKLNEAPKVPAIPERKPKFWFL